MKQKIGTFVLFGLLVLTVVALTSIDTPHTATKPGATTTAHQATN